ncbi:glycosyltransferase family 4 protein [Deinococcus yavapaiensis]|uniref:Glycosyltransferase involved in cell wall biosynthesis n=1 Tax=Deinococcus yavapaiensis KR-236 TaxID=694435 RepID=A0A318SDY7_9DEIO|nr:glycosyltransferase family 4 protein [Deinococcus yavapaiensis]PYE55271.1 glycosyltransferase involved in cell wall biosynthesis [Deinococcus yavapaiensis KR-236]
MRPLRIGLFTDVFLPDQNGVSTSILLLHAELRRRGHDAWIIAPAFPDHLDDESTVVRLRSITNPVLRRQRLAFPRKRRLPCQFDLVHTHTPWVIGWWGARLARKWNAPHITTFHTHLERYTHYIPGLSRIDRRTKAVSRIARRFYNRADFIVAPTVASAEIVQGYGALQPVRIVPTGIDEDLLLRAPVCPSPWPEGKRRLLTIGRLGHEKRFDVVLEALAQLRRGAHGAPVDAHLVHIGEGPQGEELRELAASLDLQAHVTFLGRVPVQHIGAYYRMAELFVFASDTETQGLVLTEAQMTGLPVVAVGAGGTLDGVKNGESGYLVAPGDTSAIARLSAKILADAALHEHLSRGAHAFAASSSLPVVTDRMLEVYLEALVAFEAGAFTNRLVDGARSNLSYDRRGS